MFQKIFVINYLLLALGIKTSVSQLKPEIDSTINNLVHNQGYKVGLWGELGAVKKFGTGIQSLILIPGLGFDNSVFDDFMEANKSRYRMYAVTLAGYGGTPAPPMPSEKTSYAEQT